jgi:hypothetical protein
VKLLKQDSAALAEDDAGDAASEDVMTPERLYSPKKMLRKIVKK